MTGIYLLSGITADGEYTLFGIASIPLLLTLDPPADRDYELGWTVQRAAV